MPSVHHPTNLYYRPRKKLFHLILSGTMRRVAVILLHLFSPVYIYITLANYSVGNVLPIVFILFYYFLAFFTKLLVLVFSEDLSRKIGFKATIRLSIIPFLLFIPTLILAKQNVFLFLPAAVLWGIHAGFFWWGYHGYFVKKADVKYFGESIGEANLLETIAVVVTPILGAFTVDLFGFSSLFVVSSFFMIFAIALLGKGSRTRQVHDINFKDVLGLIANHKSMSLAYVGMGAEAIVAIVIWPLFLYLFFTEIVELGIVVSLASLITAFLAVFIGRVTDKKGGRQVVLFGAPILALSWIVRFFFRTLSIFVISDSFRGFSQKMVYVPLNALSYKKAFETETAKAILFLETTQALGVLLSLIILILWVLVGGDLMLSFIMASLASLLPLISIVKKRLEK